MRREYDLRQLRSADLVMSYWMGPAIAHTLVSFGFADGRHLVFSLEIRKERGESFSALGGFFRKFEMTYTVQEGKGAGAAVIPVSYDMAVGPEA